MLAVLHISIVLAHDPLRAIPAGTAYTDLLLQVVWNTDLVQVKGDLIKLHFLEHIKGLYTMVDKTNIYEYYTVFCAGAVIVAIPVVLLFIRMQKYYVAGVVGGSVKG